MSGKIDKLYPLGAEERLRPLVRQAAEHAGADITRNRNRLTAAIDRNRWLTYRKLVIEEIAKQEQKAIQATKNTFKQEDSPDDATR